jgi:hypothetical protein
MTWWSPFVVSIRDVRRQLLPYVVLKQQSEIFALALRFRFLSDNQKHSSINKTIASQKGRLREKLFKRP